MDVHQTKIEPGEKTLMAAQALTAIQTRQFNDIDGLVLMSEEHVKLWQQRAAKLPLTAVVPSLQDPEPIEFSEIIRSARRKELGWGDKLVLIYTGNVISPWQRFPALCRFVGKLQQRIADVRLLALVRKDDMSLAKEVTCNEGIASISRVISVPSVAVASYLFAADFGLYLRHRHPMNMVVTSAKLGEYLACGLPVITTGANAEVLNSFIREVGAGVFLPDDLALTNDFYVQLAALQERMQNLSKRRTVGSAFADFFSGDLDPLVTYRKFILALTKTG